MRQRRERRAAARPHTLSGEPVDDALVVSARSDLEDIVQIVEALRADDRAAQTRARRTAERARATFTDEQLAARWAELLRWQAGAGASKGGKAHGRGDSGGDSRLDAPPRWMQPFDAWVKKGVCHDPLRFTSSSPRPFYKSAMRKGKVGVDFRRQRKWCDPKYEIRLDV